MDIKLVKNDNLSNNVTGYFSHSSNRLLSTYDEDAETEDAGRPKFMLEPLIGRLCYLNSTGVDEPMLLSHKSVAGVSLVFSYLRDPKELIVVAENAYDASVEALEKEGYKVSMQILATYENIDFVPISNKGSRDIVVGDMVFFPRGIITEKGKYRISKTEEIYWLRGEILEENELQYKVKVMQKINVTELPIYYNIYKPTAILDSVMMAHTI